VKHEPPVTGTYVCHTCGECRHVLAFAVHPSAANGIHHECRECASKRTKRSHAHRERATPHNFFGWPQGQE
jgi:hypothetical protein